jgi:hypothetical protein
MKPNTTEAIKQICKDLRTDEGYYYAWQASIAMAFCDENRRRGSRDSYKLVHEVANQAAKNFLNLLLHDVKRKVER